MKKNILRVFSIFLVIGIVVFPYNNVKADETQKGDLRCPIGYNGKGCLETKDANGKVTSVTITTTKEGYTVRKIVSKTKVLGEFNVRFEVVGQKTFQTSNNAYVMLIIDGSSTMGANYSSKAVPAAKSFARVLNNASSNIYIAFDSFHNRIFASRNFQAANLDSANFGSNVATSCSGGRKLCYVAGSLIYKAFNDANNYFKNKNGKKYIIILGDGKYYENDGDFGSRNDIKISNLKSTVDAIYSVKYGESGKYANPMYYFKNMMKSFVKSPGYYVKDKNMNNLTNVFNSIAEEIKSDVLTNVLPGYVVDNLGSQFSFTNGIGRKKILDSVGIQNNSFNIKIDHSSDTGWHNTNAGFSFNYGVGELTSNINPEVYWEQEKIDFNSCSDVLKIGSSVIEDEEYYKITCEQGWVDNNITINGFEAKLTTNGLPLNSRKFSVINGAGFPLNLNIKNNVRCTYEFDANKYVNDYNSVYSRKTNNDKELALKEKELLVLRDDILNGYINISSKTSNLVNYQDRFNNNSSTRAKIVVKYKNSSNISESELIYDQVNNNITCDNGVTSNVLGKNIFTKRVCTLSLNVNMKLQNTCLNMKDGEQIKCGTNSQQELDGGNKFYSLLDSTGGFVSVYVERADFFGSDIRLEGEKRDKVSGVENPRCEFNNQKITSNVKYRQIELSDPFIKTYNSARGVGKNWSNTKYNFQKIIDAKIWSKEFQYKYQLSKVDVENIKKTTIAENERVESYLGNDCYFNSSDKYVCSFVGRNQENNDLFTYVKIND